MVDLNKNFETWQGITKEDDVLNDVRQMHSSENSDEHEAEVVGFQKENEEVTPPSHDMLLAMQIFWKILLFCNTDQWSLLYKLNDAVEQATKHEEKQ